MGLEETSNGDSETNKNEGTLKLRALLEPVLPAAQNFTAIHMRSVPQKCRKLVFTTSKDPRLDTVSTHYFVLVHENLAIVSLELLAYESPTTFTLFISKADTTGHYYGPGRINTMAVMQAWIRLVYCHYSPPNKIIRLALFAKAEGQYLFLGSVKNGRKHLLSDAELVKWWTRCLDGLAGDLVHVDPGKCTLAVPGIDDPKAIAKYFPEQGKLPWSAGDIFWDGPSAEADQSARAVNRIPRFPDDPKSRFLDSLVSEKRAKQVTRRQYWLELQSRQEFLLGKSVGVIGLEASVRPELVHALFKEPAGSKRDCDKFKELLISLDFHTVETSTEATQRLLAAVPEQFQISFSGLRKPRTSAQQHEVDASRKRESAAQQVNMLGGGMVRKKKKTEAAS